MSDDAKTSAFFTMVVTPEGRAAVDAVTDFDAPMQHLRDAAPVITPDPTNYDHTEYIDDLNSLEGAWDQYADSWGSTEISVYGKGYDLVVNYDKLQEVADDIRTLHTSLVEQLPGYTTSAAGLDDESDPLGLVSGADTDLGPFGAAGAMQSFYGRIKGPVSDSIDRLKDLADTFSSVAQAWFEEDAHLAAQANEQNSMVNYQSWKAQKDAYDSYLHLLSSKTTLTVWDDAGNKSQKTYTFKELGGIPAVEDPGDHPKSGVTSTTENGALDTTTTTTSVNDKGQTEYKSTYTTDAGTVTTTTVLDDDGRIVSSKTVVDSTSPGEGHTDLNYTEANDYKKYDDEGNVTDVSTTTTHADASSETSSTTKNDDGTYTTTTDTGDGTSTSTSSSVEDTSGAVTSTTSTQGQDGTTVKTTQVDNPDGSSTQTVVTTDPDGTTTTTTRTRADANSSWTSETTTETPSDESDDSTTVDTDPITA